MMSTDTGGAAFPIALGWVECDMSTGHQTVVDVRDLDRGMTLRDYFAAKCDIQMYAPADSFYRKYARNPTINELAVWIAEIRFIEANAMLKERDK
jgi:hypothetical protein